MIAPFFLNAGGRREANRSLLQVEYIDILNRQLFPGEIDIKAIRVYALEGGDRRLLAELNPGTTDYMRRVPGALIGASGYPLFYLMIVKKIVFFAHLLKVLVKEYHTGFPETE